MLRFIYTALTYIAAPLLFGLTLWRGLRSRIYWQHLPERFGFRTLRPRTPCIWVHASSVGEMQASLALLRALQKRYPQTPLVLSTATAPGAHRARAQLGDSVQHAFLPYDLPGAVSRFLERLDPKLGIILETEIWPNLYAECARRQIPLVLASARISPKSVSRYQRFAALFGTALASCRLILAQTAGDAERFRAIGAAPSTTQVGGNLKFDFELPAGLQEQGRALRRAQFGARPVWIAGSTHEGEEALLLDAQAQLRVLHPELLLILVPRHTHRFDAVKALLAERSIEFVSRSSGEPAGSHTEVLLVDTLGELMMFYAAADVAFVGGSLVPIGGHNFLEPAALGIPIIAGPHNFNSQDIAQQFFASGAALEVDGVDKLVATVADLLRDPARGVEQRQKALAILEENRGALSRLLESIGPMIENSA
jgi:3-deoxy-D-manno-octulosonic-acid transferase